MGDRLALHIEPDPDDPACATVLVDGELAGAGLRFVLDTGGSRSSIVASSLSRALTQIGTRTSGGVFGTVSERIVRVPELRIGELVVRELEVTVSSRPDPRAQNVLGLDVLSRSAWAIRFSDHTVARDGSLHASKWLPLELGASMHPYVYATFEGGIRARAVLDTGAGVTVLDTEFARRHPQLVSAAGLGAGWDSTGTMRETEMATLAACEVGGVRFEASRAAIFDLAALRSSDEGADAILGYPLLRQADWLLDFPRRRWAVVRGEAQ